MNDIVLSGRNISMRYGSRVVLDDISIDIRAGEVTALLGPNGAGKRTAKARATARANATSKIKGESNRKGESEGEREGKSKSKSTGKSYGA